MKHLNFAFRIAAVSLGAVLVGGTPAFASCPDPTQDGPEFSATGTDLLAPRTYLLNTQNGERAPCGTWVVNGVTRDLIDGFLPVAPSGVFALTGMGPFIMTARAQGACDPVFALRSGDGQWYFGAGEEGRREAILWGLPDGIVQVWAGSVTGEPCEVSFTLETFDR